MKTVEHENNTLRARVRRLEEDNTRKRKEIEALYDMHTVLFGENFPLYFNNTLRMMIYEEHYSVHRQIERIMLLMQ